MTAAFIIAEYNPFHNGHEYHIKQTICALKPDAVVVVMSGAFTQRGSAAIADKWSRARSALQAGADLILELHPVYACSSAEYFARGALSTAASLNVDGWLSFGAECADPDVLRALGKILVTEDERYKRTLNAMLDKGVSFAAARCEALIERCLDKSAGLSAVYGFSRNDLYDIIKSPNNILAIEYIKAIDAAGISLKPFAVRRAACDDGDLGFASASAVRQAACADSRHIFVSASEIRNEIAGFVQKNIYDLLVMFDESTVISDSMPYYSKFMLNNEFGLGRGPVLDEMFYRQICAVVRRGDAKTLLSYPDVGEGLENRLYRASLDSGSYTELLEGASAKRYPKSRIRRIFTRILLEYTTDSIDRLNAGDGPPYLRVLGFTENGRRLLAHASPKVPVIANFKRLNRADARSKAFMELESRATDVYVTAYQNPAFRAGGQDYIRGPAYI